MATTDVWLGDGDEADSFHKLNIFMGKFWQNYFRSRR